MNLTVDDSSPYLLYSAGWGSQTTADPDFFQSTYHATEVDGATVNITFTGSAIYIYGSKGPGHANYSVQYDNFIVFLSALESETQYQQPLFTNVFHSSGSHFVSLASRGTGQNNWLDLDFVTITNPSNLSAVQASSPFTSPPPWMTSASALGSGAPSSSSAAAASSQTARPQLLPLPNVSDRLTLALSILFGAVIALVIFVSAVFVYMRHLRKVNLSRENRFRYGTSQPIDTAHQVHVPPETAAVSKVWTFGGTPPDTPVTPATSRRPILPNECDSSPTTVQQYSLSQSAQTRSQQLVVQRRVDDDANSSRTNFLQV